MPFEIWLLFLLTCCGIAIVPGPNALLVLTHGAIYGKQKTLFTIGGGVLGFIAMISLCALGLGVIIQTSATLFILLKIIGALYLVWLGINLWRSAPINMDLSESVHSNNQLLFRQGLFSALSNPKALLLFTAFISLFLDSTRNLFFQTITIALTYAVVEFGVEFFVAFAAHQVRPWLVNMGHRFNKFFGGFFIIFGVFVSLP